MHPLRAFLLGLLVLALGGCQAFPTSSSKSKGLQRVLDRGELRVGLSGSQPPLNMMNRRGEIVGLEVDLMEALAESMGLEVRLVVMPFAELLS